MKYKKFLVLVLGIILVSALSGLADAAEQIHGMRFPEISPDGSTLVFSYQGDLWRVQSTGGDALRLTAHDAYDGLSRFSPDGQRLAFESNRFGGADVLVIQSDGSNSPHRVTYSSDTDNLGCWYPSGDYLMLLVSGPMRRYNLAKRDLKNSMSVPLFEDTQIHYSPVITSDGETVFYLRSPANVRDWRSGYKGSAGGDIWSYGLKSKKHNLVYENDRSKHFLRLGHDETYLLFVDYVNQGSSNIARYDLKSGEISYLTDYVNDTVRNITVDKNGVIVYEYMNDLWRLEPGKNPNRLVIFASAEDKKNNHELKTLTSGFWGINISDNDKLVAIEVENDIFVYRTDGEVDNQAVSITNTSDKLESEPVFSLDGKSLYFFVSEGYGRSLVKVYMENLDKLILVESGDMLRNLKRIPTTDLLSFMRGPGEIVVFDPDDNSTDVIFKDKKIRPGEPTQLSWSPDGRFLTISASNLGDDEIYIIELETKKKWNISNYYKDDSNPFFSPDGKWLAFQTYTSAENEVKLVELNPETFLEKTSLIIEEEEEDEEDESPKDSDEDEEKEEEIPEVIINFERIDERARVVSFTPGQNNLLGFSIDGEWVYYNNIQYGLNRGEITVNDLWIIPTDARSKEPPIKISPSPSALFFSKKTVYGHSQGQLFQFTNEGLGDPIPFVAQRDVYKDEETKLAYKMAGQLLGEYFYDANMHDSNWDIVRNKYLKMIDDARAPEDVVAIINRMQGELNASHLLAYGPSSFTGQGDQTASLGIQWDPYYEKEGLKVRRVFKDGPADKPDIDIAPGDIVLEINGKKVDSLNEPTPMLNHKSGEVIALTVKADDETREVNIRADTPGADSTGSYKTWVEENRARVDKFSNGKLGYVHIRGMSRSSLRLFEKEYYNLTKEKDGIVIDVRFNPGGNIHESLLDILDRRLFGYARSRGWDEFLPQPLTYNRTPSICVMNESSTSDAEIFPYAYRELGLGKLVGMETYGAVIGTGERILPGGYMIRMPFVGWYRTNFKNLENIGVKPDIEVPWPPDAITKNEDPQLERAVEELLKEI